MVLRKKSSRGLQDVVHFFQFGYFALEPPHLVIQADRGSLCGEFTVTPALPPPSTPV